MQPSQALQVQMTAHNEMEISALNSTQSYAAKSCSIQHDRNQIWSYALT